MLNLNMMDASLCWGRAFQYQHVSQRRLEVVEAPNVSGGSPEPDDVSQAVVKTERGFPRYYDFASASLSGGAAVPYGSSGQFNDRMRRVTVDGTAYLEEVLGDGTIIRFRPNFPLLQHIITPLGVKITAAELAEELQVVWSENDSRPSSEVESFNSLSWYSLKQVWNKTDGLLDLRDVQRINWYAPEDVTGRRNDGIYTVRNNAVPIKTWKLSWSFLEEDTLVARGVDEDHPEVAQRMLQTFRLKNRAASPASGVPGLYPDDLTLIKGEGDEPSAL